MKIGGAITYKQARAALLVEAPRQVPYVTATMLTKLAGDVRGAFQQAMPVAFDRPTDFTLRGVYTKGATRQDLEAQVYIPQSADEQGKALREYMRPETRGAANRRQKRTEYLLSRMGDLPPGWVTTPGRGAQLDQHGNLAGSVYKQIINVLQIRYNKPKPVSVRSQKAAKRLSVEALFFVVRPGANKLGKNGGWLPPGVWKHLPGHRIAQILKFVSKASYTPKLDLRRVALEAVQRNFGLRWHESLGIIRERFAKPRGDFGPGGLTLRGPG